MYFGFLPVYRDDRVVIKGLDCQRTAALGIGGAKLTAPLFCKDGLAAADLLSVPVDHLGETFAGREIKCDQGFSPSWTIRVSKHSVR